MWSIGGNVHDEAARRERDATWRAMPTEGRAAMLGLPLFAVAAAKAVSLVPAVREAGLHDEVHAGGIIVAIASFFAVRITFAQAVEAQLRREASATSRVTGSSGERDAAWGVPALRDPAVDLRRALGHLVRRDPAFSEAALVAFARALVPRIAATPRDDARRLAPYATPLAFGEIHRRVGLGERCEVSQAVLRAVEESQHWVNAALELRVATAGGRHVGLLLTLRRSGAARSPTPVDLLAFACPACGAPVDVTHPEGACRACNTGITHGQRSWQVVDVAGPLELPWWRDGDAGVSPHPSLVAPTHPDEELDAEHRALSGRNADAPLRAAEERAGAAALAWFACTAGRAAPTDLFTEDLAGAVRYQRARLAAGQLEASDGDGTTDQVEWLAAGRDGWHDRADLRVVITHRWCVRRPDGTVVDGDADAPVTRAVIVRLLRRVGAARGPWSAWQILDPRDAVLA